MGTYSGTPPTSITVARAKATDLNELALFATAAVTAWSTWTPTLTNLTLGNGTQVAKYAQIGKTVDFLWSLTLGSTSAVGSTPSFTLPVAASTDYPAYPPLFGMLTDASTSSRAPAVVNLSSTTTIIVQYFSSLNTVANIGSTVPWTWTTSDVLTVGGRYYTA